MKNKRTFLSVALAAALLPVTGQAAMMKKPEPVWVPDMDFSWVPDLPPGDPLFSQQWHLRNTGQNAFAKTAGTPGQDMNLWLTHLLGIHGVGVNVAVIDDGLEIHHPDLAANIRPGSWDVVNNDNDPSPEDPSDNHGTAVAGLTAAVGWNAIGGRGVAPRAGLKGFNWLKNQSQEGWLMSHGAAANTQDTRVFNQSYGYSTIFPIAYDLTDPEFALEEQVYEQVTRDAHQGRGSIFVKSAGNSYRYFYGWIGEGLGGAYVLPGDFFDKSRVGPANAGLPMQDSNLTPTNANYWNLVVSALNADGGLSSYSSVGANVFVSAPGGEYGDEKPAMITTDLSGCEAGSNVTGDTSNGLHGGHELDPNCDFMGTMNGTSSAAPNTSGAVALIMSANPALSWRDIRHILASTATKTDPANSGVSLSFTQTSGDVATYDAIPGWQTNAAGYDFHNFYGFGRVNIDAAVMMAMHYRKHLPPLQITDWATTQADAVIPDAKIDGVTSTFNQRKNFVVESVQVKLDLDHERLNDLAIELVSPSGTRSVLLSPRTGLVSQSLDKSITGFEQQLLLTHHFYGEKAKGNWQLVVRDTSQDSSSWVAYFDPSNAFPISFPNNSADGVLKAWDIRFFGHKGNKGKKQ
ncbi:S8 family peptidase [Photobacterium sp. GSS17]|uniref:S8 family peptidase n=1 Tax=Photobacterium sp. GSS17 TaxID=3020715 RepID=UPI002362D0DF|nr:S8 family peptidase [Photobacterium sp. GSS17]